MRSKLSRVVSTRAATSASTDMSPGTASPPISWATAAAAPGASTSPTTTEAPSAAKRRHSARPMPDAPPVTTATFPASSMPAVSRYGQAAVLCGELGGLAGRRDDLPLDPEGAADAVEVDAVDGDQVAPDEVEQLGLVRASRCRR